MTQPQANQKISDSLQKSALKDLIVQYSKGILLKLGHRTPPYWLETNSWRGIKLNAQCKHCHKAYGIEGDPEFANELVYANQWHLFEITFLPPDPTSAAWNPHAFVPRQQRRDICLISLADFKSGNVMRDYIMHVMNGGTRDTFDPPNRDDHENIVIEKFRTVPHSFRCSKMRAWF